MRLSWLVSSVVVLLAVISPLSAMAKADSASKVVGGLAVINALRGTSDSELHQLGRQLDKGLVSQYGTTTNGLERVQRVVNRLEPDPAKRPQVRVLPSADVNAMAVPGYVYATSGLVSRANDDQLAGVMGHELSHISAGHCKRAINRARLAQGIGGALALADTNDSITTGVSLLALTTLFDYSRGEEYEADRLGAERASQAGYNRDGLASFLASTEGKGGQTKQLLSSHPQTDRRVAALREGTVGTVRSGDSDPAEKEDAGVVRNAVVSRISVSFTGFASDEFRRGFLIEAKNQGQNVDVREWGGDYQVVLIGGEAPVTNIGVDASRTSRSGYVRGGVSDIMRWQTVADIKTGQSLIGTESADATGARTHLHLGTFGRGGNISVDTYNSWLGQSLQGKTIRKLIPKVLHALQETERLRLANQPRDRQTKTLVAQPHRYQMFPVDGGQPVAVTVDRSLDIGTEIGVYRRGNLVGQLRAEVFDGAKTKVWVSGDTGVLRERGITLKTH